MNQVANLDAVWDKRLEEIFFGATKMGRRYVQIQELRDIAEVLLDASRRVGVAVAAMEAAGISEAHISVDSVVNHYLTKTAEWAIELPAKIEVEIKRRARGLEPQSVIDQKRNAVAKLKRKGTP